MRRSQSCAKPSITVYRPAWTLASRMTLISNRFTATRASMLLLPTPESVPQQPLRSSNRDLVLPGGWQKVLLLRKS